MVSALSSPIPYPFLFCSCQPASFCQYLRPIADSSFSFDLSVCASNCSLLVITHRALTIDSNFQIGLSTKFADFRIMVLVVALALFLGVFIAVLFLTSRHRNTGRKGKSHLNNDKASKSYSKTEVSLHNKRTDCWIIIKNKVYDVTSYVEEHPGGDTILTHAGDDSTEGFYGPQHATRVFDMIEDFYIGDLEQ
ncbi:hypothetical protein VNO77_32927 [Canavalia gladiata]|uniref:Cytochrome b5 heme-binding domain-containing protein n=1 Tax=Canavalia gladiata TaxID=3824 RepID=A0AAN9PVY3_CANGL